MTSVFFQKLHAQMELVKELQKVKSENKDMSYSEIFEIAKKNIEDKKKDENS